MIATATPYKICDPVHGFIRFDEIEKRVIDSRPFQRLRYIRQMGVAYLIYPGATHTRFEHSLGVMELVTRIYDQLALDIPDAPYWRQILRIAALCHDIGHLPFSHTAEKSLLPEGHEAQTAALIHSEEMRAIWKEIGSNAEEDIVKLAIGHGCDDPLVRLLAQTITEDNFGADRMDYLIRDAKFTGVGYGHFDYHQLIDSLRALGQPLRLGVTESGLQSVESLWIARYLMYARVYHHSKSRLYTFHMERFMRTFYKGEFRPQDLEWYLNQCDFTVLEGLRESARKGDFDAKALLKEGPSFEDLSTLVTDEKVLERVKKRFGERVYVNHTEPPPKEREFPVKCGSELSSATKKSEFLRNIPTGGKTFSLFVHPDETENVKKLF